MKVPLFDNIPEIRNIAAQNIGLFCNSIGPEVAVPIYNWLIQVINNNSSSIEKSGAVNAYSEVIRHNDRWESLLPELLDKCRSETTHIRESYIGLFIFVPFYAHEKFNHYLPQVFPVLKENLRHESEDIRKTAIRVLQIIISEYALSHLDLILPPLEAGLFSRSWVER